MSSKSYNDPVKQKSREAELEFILKHLGHRKRKKLKVLCFPGAENKEEAGLGLWVYDRLNIPRKNIVGVEAGPERAQRLREAKLGIEVVESLDFQFLQTAKAHDRKFDIVNLDYTSYFDADKFYSLKLIIGDQLMSHQAVLCTNFLGRRENDAAKIFLGDTDRALRKAKEFLENTDLESCVDPFGQFLDMGSKIDSNEGENGINKVMRSETISQMIANFLINGLPCNPRTFMKRAFSYSDEDYERLVQGYIDSADPEKIRSMQSYLARGTARDRFEAFERATGITANWQRSFFTDIITSDIPKGLHSFFIHSITRPYFPMDHQSYYYVSNKGSPMLLDLFHIRNFEQELRSLSSLVGYDREGKRFFYRKSHAKENQSSVVRAAKKYEQGRPQFNMSEPDTYLELQRTHLGSSYVAPRRKQKISKDDAIYLLDNGVPVEEIIETFNGFSVGQLRAYKAHITMGTYKKGD